MTKINIFLLFASFPFFFGPVWAIEPIAIRGKISERNSPLEGAYVGAHVAGSAVTRYVMSDSNGEYAFRGLVPGAYAVFTQIPGFKSSQKNALIAQKTAPVIVNLQVERETDFLNLIDQATSSELTESFPITKAQKEALHYRCGVCHGTYYIAKTRFTRKEWATIVDLMYEYRNTPGGDIAPPTRNQSASNREPGIGPPGSDDKSLVDILVQFRSPESPEFPIKFWPRATGKLTQATVTEYQLPRLGATPRYVLVDPRGSYVWYSDWRANFLGRIEIQTGEIKEYPMPGRNDRPPGFQAIRWDPSGDLWAAQIWSGQAILFDVRNEKVKAVVRPPQEWVRLGNVSLCRNVNGSVTYRVADALIHPGGTMWNWDPRSGNFTQLSQRTAPRVTDPSLFRGGTRVANVEETDCNDDMGPWDFGGRTSNAISYRDPDTGRKTEFAVKTPWGVPSNAIGDAVRKIGWTVPDYVDRVVKVETQTRQVTEFPLPSSGKEIRNIDIELSASPPALWFVNQRRGRIVRFQEFVQ
jgi:hypothetical protein